MARARDVELRARDRPRRLPRLLDGELPLDPLPGRELPDEQKPFVDFDRLRDRNAAGVRALIGDGNYGGVYQKPDADTDRLWEIAVRETRAQLEGDWA